jgi:hypothetical protein
MMDYWYNALQRFIPVLFLLSLKSKLTSKAEANSAFATAKWLIRFEQELLIGQRFGTTFASANIFRGNDKSDLKVLWTDLKQSGRACQCNSP